MRRASLKRVNKRKKEEAISYISSYQTLTADKNSKTYQAGTKLKKKWLQIRRYTVISFFGIINVGEAHSDDDCLFSTPILSSLFIYFIRVAWCIYAMGYGLPRYGLAPSFFSIETGGRFQSPSVPSKSCS